MSYKSSCRACDHNHDGYICNWQVHKQGKITLRPVYSTLWGMIPSHIHDTETQEVIQQPLNVYRDEIFEYIQEVDCGCRLYIPKDNLEYLEWKYDESDKSI